MKLFVDNGVFNITLGNDEEFFQVVVFCYFHITKVVFIIFKTVHLFEYCKINCKFNYTD
jgi:hypothetical protein